MIKGTGSGDHPYRHQVDDKQPWLWRASLSDWLLSSNDWWPAPVIHIPIPVLLSFGPIIFYLSDFWSEGWTDINYPTKWEYWGGVWWFGGGVGWSVFFSKLISVDFNVSTEAVNRLCIHCNGFPKYGCVGVYCPGLGLCRESAVGNKTIAMNCLRIMLGINSPCTAQSAKQSNPIKIHSVQSPVQDFVLQLPLIEYAPYLRVVSWIISISGILVGPVWVSWSDVCEWRAENYLLSLPGNVTPTPSVRQPPTILNTW